MGNVKKVVLAYSGGLDTSIIIPWLKENYGGAEVVAFCGDVGQGDDYEAVKRKARETGASKCIVKDLREEFVRDYCYKALSAGAVYEDRYLLGTALARPLLAYHQVQVAIREKADALAHGATGKGRSAPARTRSTTRGSTACPWSRRRRTSSAATGTSGTSLTRAGTSRTCGTPRRRGCSS
jgi:argininosuccinate synthase